jgi:hypothetical protein
LEPFGWEAQCYSSGIVAATIANVHRDPKKHPKFFSPADFVPGERKKKAIDGKVLKAQLQLAHAGVLAAKRRGKQNG